MRRHRRAAAVRADWADGERGRRSDGGCAAWQPRGPAQSIVRGGKVRLVAGNRGEQAKRTGGVAG